MSSSSLFHDRIDAAQQLLEKLIEWLKRRRRKEEEEIGRLLSSQLKN